MTMLPTLTPRAAREQQTFRVLLSAMARPGSIGRMPVPEVPGQSRLLTVAEALVDHEVTFAVLPERPELIDAVLRLTGSRQAAVEAADYVFCESASLAETLGRVKDGTLEYPDASATVVCEVAAVEERGPDAVGLSGPGIKGTLRVQVGGFGLESRAAFRVRNALPPTGVDVVFVSAAGHVTCLSRYTKLELED
ncbi:MAG TPA: phosphonate C-P lyase system protein PhnH [Dehalococcoidia bacterium]|jgi:phosphonate C-P lyase system protein PhnH